MISRFERLWYWVLIWLFKNLYGYSRVSVRVLYAQAVHETGDFKSEVFKENNNLFGMRHPKIRRTKSQGDRLHHAVYKSPKDSIVDYFYRQKHFKIPNVADSEYIDRTVASNYAEDKQYEQKWRWWAENLPNVGKNIWLYVIGFFFVVIGFVYIIRNVTKQNRETRQQYKRAVKTSKAK